MLQLSIEPHRFCDSEIRLIISLLHLVFEEPFPVFGPDFNEAERPWLLRRMEDVEEQALRLVDDGGPSWSEGRKEFVGVSWVDFDRCMESQLTGLEGLGAGHCEEICSRADRRLLRACVDDLKRRLCEKTDGKYTTLNKIITPAIPTILVNQLRRLRPSLSSFRPVLAEGSSRS